MADCMFLALKPDKPRKIYGWPAFALCISLHFCVMMCKNTAEPVMSRVIARLIPTCCLGVYVKNPAFCRVHTVDGA